MRDRATLRLMFLILSAALLAACGIDPAPGDGPLGETHEALCSAVTLSPSPGDSALPGASIVWTATPTCQLASPELEFWVLDPTTGSWSVAQAYSSATTYTWQVPSVAAGSVYGFQVWARDAGSTAGYEAWGQASFTVASPQCTGVSATFSPTSGPAGTQVTITGSETGCPAAQAEYEIWYLAPGGSSYDLLDPYSTSASYTWDTTGATPGTYDFQIWARSQGADDGYESWAGYTYDVLASGSTPCSAVSTTSSPSFVTEGASVTLASGATACSSPEYEVWMLPPGGSWQVLQTYAASAASYAWTAPSTTGTYDFQVWARDQSSSSTYDAWDTFAVTVNAAATVSATTSPAGTAPADTFVTIASSSTGLPNPEYEVWYLPPGASSWQVLEPYSASTSYVWNTLGAATGTYDFQVWAQQQGNTDAYDAWTQFTYVVTTTTTTGVELCCPAGQNKISPLRCASADDPAFGCGAAWQGGTAAPPAACSGGRAQWGCSAGACAVLSCDSGFADCDGNPANGCEADLSSTASCGGCGVTCAAGQVCTPSGCSTSCPAPLTNCNGSCVDLNSSLGHCGACGTACADPANGVATCFPGICGVSCNAGYASFNGKCYDTSSDPTCCGSSCTQCPAAPTGGDMGCVSGACTPLCESGMVVCNGACAEIASDPANCGGCGNTCSGVCVGGACDATGKEILATGLAANSIVMMVADGTSVFWIDGASEIRQVDRAGTTAPITLATGQNQALSLAVDSTSVYWVNHNGGGVWKATKGTPGATLVASATAPEFVAVNSSYVYYDNSERNVYRVATSGGTPQMVWSITPYPDLISLAADDSYLWGAVSNQTGAVWRANLDGTNLTYFPNTSEGWETSSLVVVGSGNMLYCTPSSTGSWCGTLVEATGIPAGPNLPNFSNTPVAVDSTYAYGLSGNIVRAGICGGPTEIMGTGGAYRAAVDDSWLYWADENSAIHRRAK